MIENSPKDEEYISDYNKVLNVYGTLQANKVDSNTPAPYWVASRGYEIQQRGYNFDMLYPVRYINAEGTLDKANIYSYHYECDNDYQDHQYGCNQFPGSNYMSNSIRPILTLKSTLKYIGEGTEEDPCVIVG